MREIYISPSLATEHIVPLVRQKAARHKQLRILLLTIFSLILIVSTWFRFILSKTLNMWYAFSQTSDDQLLMSYTYDTYLSSDNSMTLAKNRGYSFFLWLVGQSGINIDTWQFAVWLVAAVLVGIVFWFLSKSIVLSGAIYLFVLWNPLAFENWLGTRTYRNSLFPPMLFAAVALLVIFVIFSKPSKNSIETREETIFKNVGKIFLSFAYGATCIFIFLLKEDGIWLIPGFIISLIIVAFRSLRHAKTTGQKIVGCILVFVPLITFFTVDHTYKSFNQNHFGVYLRNTRTEGELAKFVSNVYRIKDPNQTTVNWTPTRSIDKVIGVSPTLRSNPKFLEALEHSGFAAPDLHTNQLTGEFLQWQVRHALTVSDLWVSESYIQQLFSQINREVDQAFNDGYLQETEKIFLLKSLGPRTPEEILDVAKSSIKLYLKNLLLIDWKPTTNSNLFEPSNIDSKVGLKTLNFKLSDPNPQVVGWFGFSGAQNVSTIVLTLYQALVLILLSAFGMTCIRFVYLLIRGIVPQKLVAPLIASMALLGYAAAYTFATRWFVDYVFTDYARGSYIAFFMSAGSTTPLVIFGLLLFPVIGWKKLFHPEVGVGRAQHANKLTVSSWNK